MNDIFKGASAFSRAYGNSRRPQEQGQSEIGDEEDIRQGSRVLVCCVKVKLGKMAEIVKDILIIPFIPLHTVRPSTFYR
jgi:hypothetical protein